MINTHLKKQTGNAEIELVVWVPFTLFFIWFLSDLNLYLYSQNQAEMLASDLAKILSNADNVKLDEPANQERWLNLAKFQLKQSPLNKSLGLTIALSDKDNIQSWQMGECEQDITAQTTSELFPAVKQYEKARRLWWVSVCINPKGLVLSQNILPFLWPNKVSAHAVFLARGQP